MVAEYQKTTGGAAAVGKMGSCVAGIGEVGRVAHLDDVGAEYWAFTREE